MSGLSPSGNQSGPKRVVSAFCYVMCQHSTVMQMPPVCLTYAYFHRELVGARKGPATASRDTTPRSAWLVHAILSGTWKQT